MKKTITFSSKWYDREFEALIAPKLRENFPQYQFAHVQDSNGHIVESWTAWENNKQLDIRLEIADRSYFKNDRYDLIPFLQKTELDLRLFDTNSLKAVSDEKRVFGLPFNKDFNTHVLFYNEDIFRKFGVPIPEHGMSWDDVIALAANVTGTIDGIPYYGLDIADPTLIRIQLGMTFLDPVSHEPRLRESDCQEYFRIVKAAYGIPGNLQDTEERILAYGTFFPRKGNVAMSIHDPMCIFSRNLSFKIGAVTFPRIGNTLLIPSVNYSWFLTLHPESQQRNEAFEVIAYMVSEEFQSYMARNGRYSSLKGHRYEKEFAQDNPSVSGIDMSWVFQGNRVGFPDPQSPYESLAGRIVKEEMKRAVRRQISWNEAIMTMEDRIREKILAEI